MRICILQHEPESPAGYFEEWARLNGHSCSVLDVVALTDWPQPQAYDLIVSLGSECSVHASPDRWIPTEVDFLRHAHRNSVRVFGICFGAQALAAALGGQVHPAARPHGEWREIESHEPQVIPRGPWLRWHQDVFELPAGGALLAGTHAEPLASEAEGSVGLQFHPEATPEIVERWIETGRHRLAAQGIDEAQLRKEIDQGLVGARERAFDLFDRLSVRWIRTDAGTRTPRPSRRTDIRHSVTRDPEPDAIASRGKP